LLQRYPRNSENYFKASKFLYQPGHSYNTPGILGYIRGENAKKAYQLLLKNKEAIEAEIQDNLDWQELPDGQDSRIVLYSDGNIRERDNWAEYFRWFKEYAERFHKAFSDRIQSLSL